MIEGALAVALICVIALQAWTVFQHSAERKDLLTRIMAKDLDEYEAATHSRPPPKGGNFIKAGMKRHQKAGLKDAGSD